MITIAALAATASTITEVAQAAVVRTRAHADPPLFGQSSMSAFAGAADNDGPISVPAERLAAHGAVGSPPPATFRVASAPPTTWCGTSRTTDDIDHQISDAPRIKVIYAITSDGADRLGMYADLFQQAATWIANSIAASAGNLRAPRFDYGLACDPQALDITTMRLPSTTVRYQSMGSAARGEQLLADVHAGIGAMQLAAGNWNYLVFADAVGVGRQGGYGEWYEDDRPGPDNKSASGGKAGIIEGGGGPAFMGGTNPDLDRDYLAYTATHELGHTLGAVQDSAPHSTRAGHCTDGFGIMCYNDTGPNHSAYETTSCPVGGATSITFAGIQFDCNNDDYLSPSPPADSYLATHWNIFNSPFMCDVTVCVSKQIAPTAHLQMDPVTPRPGQTVTLSGALSTDPDSNIAGYAFDTDDNATEDYGAPAASAATTFTAPAALGSHVVRLQVTDSTGLTNATSLAYTVAGVAVPPGGGSGPPNGADNNGTSTLSNTPRAGTARISRIIHNHHGITMVTVSCPSTAGACKGTVKISYARHTRSAPYNVAAGRHKQLKVKPPGGITVNRVLSARVAIRDSSANRDVSRKVQLKP